MNTEWLRSFTETASARSLSKAAEKLHLSQPALSKQIRSLEMSFGVKLLHRSSKGVELTEAGTALLMRARSVLLELSELEAELQAFRTDRKTLKIGALPSLALSYLPAKVIQLQKQHVHVEVHVLSTSEELMKTLQMGLIEAALLDSKHVRPPYWGKELFHEPYYAAVPKGHPLSDRTAVSLRDLSHEPLVVHPEQCDVRRSIVEAYARQGYQPIIAAELAFGESVPSYVAAGAGIAILPELTARSAQGLGLITAPIVDFGASRSISLATRYRNTGEKLAAKLIGLP